MAVVQVKDVEYYIDDKLKERWDKIRDGRLIKHDEDRVYIVDGKERSGKSLFSIQQAAYLDPNFNLDRICFTPDELLKQIKEAPSGSAIIFDEAFRGLSSAQSRSNTNQQIKTALMEMGQRNLILFIVLPSFFLLDMYAAILRSHALFHIQKEVKSKRRVFMVFNEKKKWLLYHMGVKNGASYRKPFTKFRGNFYGKYPIDEEAYRAKKAKSLTDLYGTTTPETNKDRENWEFLLAGINITNKLPLRELETYLEAAPIPIRRTTIGDIVKKHRKTWENLMAVRPNI